MVISCEVCGSEFKRTGKEALKARFCSMSCKSAASGAMQKECEVCSKSFRSYGARAANARFCSQKCKGVAFRVTFNCEVCGTDAYGFQNRNKRWCSSECAGLARRAGEDRTCKLCNASFYVTKTRIDAGQGVFCSIRCHNLNQGRNKSDHICKMCGDSFRWSPSRTESGRYNVTYCSIPCRNADPDHHAMLLAAQARQSKGPMTKTEALGYALLDSLGVEYQAQALFANKFVPDAVIPSARLVVQFDGDYWHDKAGTSTEPRIMHRVSLDRSQDKYTRACGWDVVRLWDSELRDNPELCRERVSAALRRPLGAGPERDPLARA